MRRPPVVVAPLLVGPANALAATGLPWRWLRDFWAARGRSFVGAGYKRAIPAAALLDELAASGVDPAGPPLADAAPADPAEVVRRALGLSQGGSA